MKIPVDYPTAREERDIVYRMGGDPPRPRQILTPQELLQLQRLTQRVFVDDAIIDYVVRLVLVTRTPKEHGLEDVGAWLTYGASPRASLGLIAAGRALALVRGRGYVLPQDVVDVIPDVLRHRLILSYDALADGVPVEHVIARVMQTVPPPQIVHQQAYSRPGQPVPQGARPGSAPYPPVPPGYGSPPRAPGAGGPQPGWQPADGS
jgi:MoxR-like ATPase